MSLPPQHPTKGHKDQLKQIMGNPTLDKNPEYDTPPSRESPSEVGQTNGDAGGGDENPSQLRSPFYTLLSRVLFGQF